MSIYTKGGDFGETSLLFSGRAAKDDCRIELVGAVDELSAQLGVVKALCGDEKYADLLEGVQKDLINMSGYFVSLGEKGADASGMIPDQARVSELEDAIDAIQSILPPQKGFVIYGSNILSAQAHVARAVCRRAERQLYTVNRDFKITQSVRQYLNRLSDLLFCYARLVS